MKPTKITPDNIGEVLKNEREAQRISLRGLAQKAKSVSPNTLANIEQGANSPSFANLYAVAQALGKCIIIKDDKESPEYLERLRAEIDTTTPPPTPKRHRLPPLPNGKRRRGRPRKDATA